MSHEKAPEDAGRWEWVLAQLVGRNAGVQAELGEEDESTIRSIEAQLDTLAADLRNPPPVDEFAEESGCELAIELVERIGVRNGRGAAGENELRRIGPYEVIAQLRQGGMGTVYKAVHSNLQRVVAVKILPAFRAQDAGAVARFRREMLAVGNLQHRNIVAATDAGEVDGMHYLVMEYVDGIDLSTLVRRVGPLETADACEIISQAAEGVEEAHRRGIIHRDIKPSNLILVEGGNGTPGAIVKVLDFGLARLAEEFADDELTTSGQIMGTLKYMAPEQCMNSRDVDVRADVYSLGATLYRLLSGQAPFSGSRFDSPPALVAALSTEAPERLRSLRGDLPPQLTSIVECMMAKDPAKRYATPGEAIQSLTPWTKGADLAGLLARARAAETALPPPRLFREPRPVMRNAEQVASNPVARRHLPLWMPLLLGVAALAVLAYLVAPRSDSAPPAQEARGRAAALSPERDSSARSREVVQWLVQQRPAEAVIMSAGPEYATLKTGDAVPTESFELVSAILTDNKNVRDKDLARFDELTEFTSLSLARTEVGDAGLKRLGELPALEILFLSGTKVGDAGVAELKRYPRLKVLQLYENLVTNQGVEAIATTHQQLGELSLVGCKVDDRGVKCLESLKTLILLALDRTGVTVAGVARLQIALPNCEIRSDFSAEEVAAAMERERARTRSLDP